MASISSIINVVLEAKDKASPVIKKAGGSLSTLTKHVEKNEKAFKRAGLAGAAMLGTLGLLANNSRKQVQTQSALATAIKNVGGSAESVAPGLEEMIRGLQGVTGVSDEVQRTTLTTLVGLLGDVDRAAEALPSVLDAAAFSGMGVTEVARTMGRGLSGLVNTVESVGISFDENATFSERLAQVHKTVGGTAEAVADSFKRTGAVLADVGDAIGTKLLPILNLAADAIAWVGKVFLELPAPVQTAIAVVTAFIGLFLGGTGLLLILPKATAALAAFKLAFVALSGPVGWVIGALGAVGAGVAWAISTVHEEAESAEPAVVDLNKALDKTGTAASNAANKTEVAAKRLFVMTTNMQSAADALSKTVADSLEVGGVTEASEETAKTILTAFDLIPENAGRLVDNAGQFVTEFESQLNSFDKRWERIPDTQKTALIEMAGNLASELGVNLDEIKIHGKDVTDEMFKAYDNATAEVKTSFAAMKVSTDNSLNALAEATKNGLKEGVEQPTVEMADTVISELERVEDKQKAVIMNLPNIMKSSLNAFADGLEHGYNNNYLEWLNRVVDTIKIASSLPGAPAVLGNLEHFEPLKLDRFQQGTLSSPGGAAIVGESGPELALFPPGTRIFDAGSTAQLASQPAGGGGGLSNFGEINVFADNPSSFLDELEELL